MTTKREIAFRDSSVPLSWLKYLSQFYYGTEAVSLTQWPQIRNIGKDAKTRDTKHYSKNFADCRNEEGSCISNGLEVLEKYGYGRDNYTLDCLGLLTIFFVCNVLAYLVLRRRSQKQAVY